MEEVQKAKKPLHKKWWVWVLGVVLVIAVIGGAGKKKEATATAAATEQKTEAKTETKAEEPKAAPAATSNFVTLEMYEKIGIGMTIAQVESIFGYKGEPFGKPEKKAKKREAYLWNGVQPGTNVMIFFADNRVESKSQNGLIQPQTKPVPAPRAGQKEKLGVTMRAFGLIQKGMTVADVSRIIGSNGEEVTSTKWGAHIMSTYRWKIDPKQMANISISCEDGKVVDKTQYELK